MPYVNLTPEQISILESNSCTCESINLVMVQDNLTTTKKKNFWIECLDCGKVGDFTNSEEDALDSWIQEVGNVIYSM